MRPRVYQLLAAGLFMLGFAVAPGPVLAQAEPGRAPEATAPDAQARENAAPSPRGGPEQAKPEGGTEAGPDESDMQQGCPDQRRPLQLIV
jgi:hypothetical protein